MVPSVWVVDITSAELVLGILVWGTDAHVIRILRM